MSNDKDLANTFVALSQQIGKLQNERDSALQERDAALSELALIKRGRSKHEMQELFGVPSRCGFCSYFQIRADQDMPVCTKANADVAFDWTPPSWCPLRTKSPT